MSNILLGDCVRLMINMPQDSVDLCFADPPYNAKDIGPDHRTYSLGQMQLPREDYKVWCDQWFIEARRVSKMLLLTPGIANMNCYPQPDWVIAWHKPAAVSFNRFGGFNVWEPIFIYGKLHKNVRLPHDYLNIQTHNEFGRQALESQHPCPKPLALMRRLVKVFTEEGDLVMDPFAGSGTTLRAAKDLGREWLGMDINPEYVELCEKRLRQEVLL